MKDEERLRPSKVYPCCFDFHVSRQYATLTADLLKSRYMTDIKSKKVVLGVTGGVAAYKAAELVRRLSEQGIDVHVVMTQAACGFITPATMQALSGNPVYTDMWDARIGNSMAHIELSRDKAAIIIAPATADFMAKLVHGHADDLLSTLCLARDCALLVAPAMNRQMWDHPATQRNVAQLEHDGVTLLGPASGDQACGEVGDGRMLEPDELLEELIGFFRPKPLVGKRVLITAGPTFEPIDPVRGITNLSSGKMGFALARAAAEAGAEVTLVAGPVHLSTPRGVHRIDVRTALQMFDAVVPEAPKYDVFVATAAVADWRPARLSEQKIKKNGSKVAPIFELTENPDLLAAVAQQALGGGRPFCVGFAAESHDLLKHSREKRERKQVPLIVGNLGPATFGRDDNALVLVDAHGHRELPQGDKLMLARLLVADIALRLTSTEKLP